MGRPKVKKDIRTCLICKCQFEAYPSSKKKLCSKVCMGKHNQGTSNPNYGKRWSASKKETQSDLIRSKITADYRELAGSANRGKKFDATRIQAMHQHRSSSSYARPHTEQSRYKIGLKSKQKFTPEFKKRIRNKMVADGIWTSDKDKSALSIYQTASHWIGSMWEYADSTGQQNLKMFGVFNARKNQKGCVRDHKLSKLDGFLVGLYPEILRHPANLEILSHSKNASKNKKSSITVDDLFHSITNFAGEWKEQDLVLELIQKFKDGQRVNVDDYRREVV